MKKALLLSENGNYRDYNNFGCSPHLLESFIGWLSEQKANIAELNLALYLFNNEVLLDTLISLASVGVKVTVYSIPIEGYDNRYPRSIIEYHSGISLGNFTKYDLANKVYGRIRKEHIHNFELRIVPHMYLRSKRVHPFSRGSMPYSLHIKSFAATMKNGDLYAGLTSSNFAVRDAQKNEAAVICQLDEPEALSTTDFYLGLYENSISFFDFDASGDYSHFQVRMRPTPPKSRTMYVAPFYSDSASDFEANASSIVNRAKSRLIVCAQHISAYNYAYEDWDKSPAQIRKPGFLSAVIERANSGITTSFLSQTYVDSLGTHNCRSPENKGAFIGFVDAAKKAKCSYYVNEDTHSKFIVSDNHVILTTCNFTPTQFIYIPRVEIEQFERMPDLSYSGIHCEIGAYFVVSSSGFADQVSEEFNKMIQLPRTQRMF